MKAQHKKNLLKLADYLDTVKKEKFHMKEFRANEELIGLWCSDPGFKSLVPSCGTAACALGHAPALFPRIWKQKLADETYYSGLCRQVFGVWEYSDAWTWCFDSGWSKRDNTPKGAAKRIRYMVENGVPENTLRQMNGDAPLCYTRTKKATKA